MLVEVLQGEKWKTSCIKKSVIFARPIVFSWDFNRILLIKENTSRHEIVGR